MTRIRILTARLGLIAAAGLLLLPAGGRAAEKEDRPARSRRATTKQEGPTLPTELDEWDLEKDFAKIAQQWDALEEVLRSDEYFRVRVEDVSQWSCGLQAGHSVLVMNMIAKGIEEGLADPTRNAEETAVPMAKMILKSGIMPRGVGKAPGLVMPLSGDREHWLRMLGEARERWDAIAKKAGEVAESKAREKHPVFGFLTPAEWVRFAPIHTAHHLKIIRDILAAAGEPAEGLGKALTLRQGEKP